MSSDALEVDVQRDESLGLVFIGQLIDAAVDIRHSSRANCAFELVIAFLDKPKTVPDKLATQVTSLITGDHFDSPRLPRALALNRSAEQHIRPTDRTRVPVIHVELFG